MAFKTSFNLLEMYLQLLHSALVCSACLAIFEPSCVCTSIIQPINLAYTSAALAPHMDLPYYEAPPGLQLLHCLEFDEACAGGESVFWDTFVLAELLRERDPRAFQTLCQVHVHKRSICNPGLSVQLIPSGFLSKYCL